MVFRSDSPPPGNLRTRLTNPQASQASIRTGRQFSANLAKLGASGGQGAAQGGGSLVFDAMMAVNQSQNQVINQVLDGPVSQQTQRQLAQIRAINMQDQNLDELTQLREKPAEQAAVPNTGQRIFGNLRGGRTMKRGLETGKVFSPVQMESFRKKNGLLRQIRPAPAETPDPVKTAGLPAGGVQLSQTSPIKSRAQAAAQSALNPPAPEVQNKSRFFSGENIDAIINKVGDALGLDPSLIKAVVKTESNFDEKAVSRAGAKGLMQLMPGTAKEMGVSDPFNPFENIWGGARYLKKMLDRHGGNVNKALAAYNWGPGNFDRSGGVSLPRETRRYIEVVNRNYDRFKRESQVA
jgi:hypothetical protein